MEPFDIRESAEGISFPVRVTPRSCRNEVLGVEAGRLRIRLTAPPVGGEANEACVALVAKLFQVRKAQIKIVNGSTSRDKLISVSGVGADTLRMILRSIKGGNTVGGL